MMFSAASGDTRAAWVTCGVVDGVVELVLARARQHCPEDDAEREHKGTAQRARQRGAASLPQLPRGSGAEALQSRSGAEAIRSWSDSGLGARQTERDL